MQLILAGLQYYICLCYIDDIVIFSSTFEEHLSHISLVLDRLIKANLKAKPQKCMFAKKEVWFLGNILSKDGIKPDPGKTRAIKEMKSPTNVKGLCRALGLMGFYGRFVPHFQIHASALYHLLKNDVKWNWSEKCDSGFNHLKQALVESPILGYPDFTKPFIVYTDASIVGLGSMLVQEQ